MFRVPGLKPGGLPGGFGLHPVTTQFLGKGLAPPLQVGLARVESFTVDRLCPHAEVHVRVRLVVVQHHHILVVGQLGLCKLARRPLDDPRVRAAWHGQHDVERLAPVSFVCDQAAAIAPLVAQLVDSRPSLQDFALFVLHAETAVLADVPEVRRNGQHAPPSPGDLDHDLRRPLHHGGFNALADGVRALMQAPITQSGLRPHLDHPVAREEQAITPLDEYPVDVRRLAHGFLLEVTGWPGAWSLWMTHAGADRPSGPPPGRGDAGRLRPACRACRGRPLLFARCSGPADARGCGCSG